MMTKKIILYCAVIGCLFLGGTVAMAAAPNEVEALTAFRLLREFSVFLNIALIILVIIMAASIHGALKFIGKEKGVINKMKLFWYFLSHEPADLFSHETMRDKNGTYMMSYDKYKRYQNLSRKTLLRTIGLIFIKVMIITILIYGISFLARYSAASENKLLESENFMMELDK